MQELVAGKLQWSQSGCFHGAPLMIAGEVEEVVVEKTTGGRKEGASGGEVGGRGLVVFCVSVCFCLHSSLSFLCCSVCRLVSFSVPAVSRASSVPAEKRRRTTNLEKGGGFAAGAKTGGCRACRVSALVKNARVSKVHDSPCSEKNRPARVRFSFFPPLVRRCCYSIL